LLQVSILLEGIISIFNVTLPVSIIYLPSCVAKFVLIMNNKRLLRSASSPNRISSF
jgi:hypothetical protein